MYNEIGKMCHPFKVTAAIPPEYCLPSLAGKRMISIYMSEEAAESRSKMAHLRYLNLYKDVLSWSPEGWSFRWYTRCRVLII